MNIFNLVKLQIQQLVNKYNSVTEVLLESPKNKTYGDISTNIAMALSKQLSLNPMDIANEIVRELEKINISYIKSYNVIKPGFINICLNHSILFDFLSNLNLCGTIAFDEDLRHIGQGKKINIEFCSANPTGPMHIGHSRSAIYGDVLCKLLKKCNFQVTAEYYINDGGAQVETLVKSHYCRYQQLLGHNIELPDGCYPGEYLIDVASKLLKIHGINLSISDDGDLIKEFVINEMMLLIKDDLKKLQVQHDVFTSEAALIKSGAVEQAITLLEAKGLMYYGILEKPKGNAEDWEPREQLLFRSTVFGDDVDRAIIKSDNTYAYFASDIALHLDKISRGYDELLLLLGADHAGYISRIKAAVRALSDGKLDIEVMINQLVNIYKDGMPVRMSKRKGNFLTVSDLLDDLHVDVLRFAMLMQKNSTVIDIDCNKLIEKSKDNPIFYIQYAHTRVVSIIKNAHKNSIFNHEEVNIDDNYHFAPQIPIDYSLLNSEIEIDLIKYLVKFPRILEMAAKHKEPHRINYYLYELANYLHQMWHAGIEHDTMRCILIDNKALSRARVSLMYSVAIVIFIGFDIIGVKPLLEM